MSEPDWEKKYKDELDYQAEFHSKQLWWNRIIESAIWSLVAIILLVFGYCVWQATKYLTWAIIQ